MLPPPLHGIREAVGHGGSTNLTLLLVAQPIRSANRAVRTPNRRLPASPHPAVRHAAGEPHRVRDVTGGCWWAAACRTSLSKRVLYLKHGVCCCGLHGCMGARGRDVPDKTRGRGGPAPARVRQGRRHRAQGAVGQATTPLEALALLDVFNTVLAPGDPRPCPHT